MKIINEKGKLFGLINIVDLLVLIAAVAVAAGVGYAVADQDGKASALQPEAGDIRRRRGLPQSRRQGRAGDAPDGAQAL